nr:MAG TPA: hypothetical protein [Caudoviricetes sp.]DAQ26527.1 MAG TPA: hypothetical protein [Caudoviricetes sp.]
MHRSINLRSSKKYQKSIDISPTEWYDNIRNKGEQKSRRKQK